MTTKHTPGPWRVAGRRTHGPSTGARDITQTVITVPHSNGPWEAIGVRSQNEEADAHLIAAAPDMLEALEALYAASTDVRTTTVDLGSAEEAARAAIAKAKGTP